MADSDHVMDPECERTLTALARGSAGSDWEQVERHLVTCSGCAAGLQRLTAAIDQQFAAGRSLDDAEAPTLQAAPGAASEPPAALPAGAAAAESGDNGRVVPFAGRQARPSPGQPSPGLSRISRRTRRRLLAAIGIGVAAAVVLAGSIVIGLGSSGGAKQAVAGRRPQFVPSLDVLPARADHTYYAGEQVQVCLRINQPSRIHLSVLEGHTTFNLYDADSDPGQHCFPEQVGTIHGRATLRVEVFYGSERVAREDFVLLPAAPAPTP